MCSLCGFVVCNVAATTEIYAFWHSRSLHDALPILNTLVLIGPMMLIALLKLVLPVPGWKERCSHIVMWVAETWANICKAVFALMIPTEWEDRKSTRLNSSH